MGVALGTALLLVWANLAVVAIGTESEQASLLYVGVLAIGSVAAIGVRLRPRGMVWAMCATALAQGLVAGLAVSGALGEPVTGSLEIMRANGLFVALWLLSATLFRAAAGQPSADARWEG